MRGFWDEKAQENPLWYIYSGLSYHDVDEAAFWRSGEVDVAAVLAEAGVERGAAAIDIGCGVGRLTRALASRFDHVEGFDVSPKMIELAREHNAGRAAVTFTAIERAGKLPVDDASVDFVLTLQVLQHIPSRAVQLSYVREAGRALKPGGTLAFQMRTCLRADPVTGFAEQQARSVLEAIRRKRNPPAAGIDSPAWSGARPGLWQVKASARAAGLTITKTRWISRQGASMMLIARKSI